MPVGSGGGGVGGGVGPVGTAQQLAQDGAPPHAGQHAQLSHGDAQPQLETMHFVAQLELAAHSGLAASQTRPGQHVGNDEAATGSCSCPSPPPPPAAAAKHGSDSAASCRVARQHAQACAQAHISMHAYANGTVPRGAASDIILWPS